MNEKVLNPSALEKVNVQLANSVFHESTIAALFYYADHGYPEFAGTAGYLKMVRTWFNLLNVKSKYFGKNVNDLSRCPITEEDGGSTVPFLVVFLDWSS